MKGGARMCFATAATIAAVTAAAGAGVSAYGQYQSGQSTKAAQNYQAQVAKNNQLIAEQQAEHAIAAGEAQAQATSLKAAARGAKIKAALAANGIDVNTGSAVDVEASDREIGQLDSETILNNAQLAAYGYRSQSTNYGAQSELDKLTGENAAKGAEIGAVGSLLSNAGSIGLKWSAPAGNTSSWSNSNSFLQQQPEDI